MQTSKECGGDLGNKCSNVEVAVDRMETQQTSTVEANMGNKLQKKASKKSQQALEGKAQCMDEEIT